MITLPTVKCQHCGYEFIPRVPRPKECPECRKRHPIATLSAG